MTSEIRLSKAIDRETLETAGLRGDVNITSGIQAIRLRCELTRGGVALGYRKGRVNVTVIDVNDNPPTFLYRNHTQHIVKNIDGNGDESSFVSTDVCASECVRAFVRIFMQSQIYMNIYTRF